MASLRTIGLIATAYGALILLASAAERRGRRTRRSCDTQTSSTTSPEAKASDPTTEHNSSLSPTVWGTLPAHCLLPQGLQQYPSLQFQGSPLLSTAQPVADTRSLTGPTSFHWNSYSLAYLTRTPLQQFSWATKRLLYSFLRRLPTYGQRRLSRYSYRTAWNIWLWSLDEIIQHLYQKIRKG